MFAAGRAAFPVIRLKAHVDRARDREHAGSGFGTVPAICALEVKAEAMYLVDRASEAIQGIREAEALAEAHEERWWCAELHRLRGVFLTAVGAEETVN